jgi:hypothetical protein
MKANIIIIATYSNPIITETKNNPLPHGLNWYVSSPLTIIL